MRTVRIILLLIIPVILLSASVIGVHSDSDEDEGEHGSWIMISSELCTTCHKEVTISVKEMATLGCSSCHYGDPGTTSIELAHKNLISNPLNKSVLSKTCGQCHRLSSDDVRKFIYGYRRMHPSTGEIVLANLTGGGSESCLNCHQNITIGISGMKNLTCTVCHGGDPSSLEKDLAHSGLIIDPLEPGIADKTCGQCHSSSVYGTRIEIHPRSAQQLGTTTMSSTTSSTTEVTARVESPTIDGIVSDGEYSAKFDLGKVTVYTRTEGDVAYIAVVGKTTGWVAIGFGATEGMKDADIIIGWVSGGRTHVLDSYSTGKTGPHKPDTSLGGSNNILEYAGSEVNGITTIEFARKLVTGDQYDKPLRIGTNAVIWAIGDSDDPKDIHVERGSGTIVLRKAAPTTSSEVVTETPRGSTASAALETKTLTLTYTEFKEQLETVTEVKTVTVTETVTVGTSTLNQGIYHLTSLLGIPVAIVIAMVLVAFARGRSQ